MHPGRSLMILGGLLFLAGLLWTFAPRLPFRPGHLPGDFIIHTKNSTFYFPLASCLLASLLLSLLFALFRKR